jgi:hypothetical protein
MAACKPCLPYFKRGVLERSENVSGLQLTDSQHSLFCTAMVSVPYSHGLCAQFGHRYSSTFNAIAWVVVHLLVAVVCLLFSQDCTAGEDVDNCIVYSWSLSAAGVLAGVFH